MNVLIPLTLNKVLQTKSYTVIVLGAEDKLFSLYVQPTIGRLLQTYFSNTPPLRPDTYEFIDRCFLGLEVRVVRWVLEDIRDTVFFAKVLLEKTLPECKHLVEVDVRPSDGLVMALRHGAPLFCSKKVREEAIPYED